MPAALSPDEYYAALYRHMERIAPLLARIDGEIELVNSSRDRYGVDRLETMRAITISGLFDIDFYRATYSDVASDEFEALAHYVQYGEAEGRKPNVVFSAEFYRGQASAIAPLQGNALRHYAEHGEPGGRKPGLGFDPHAYFAANPALGAFVDKPLFHFLRIGLPAGLPPRPAAVNRAGNSAAAFALPSEPRDRAYWERLVEELELLSHRPAPSPSRGNLIMGLAIGYPKRRLLPFVRSLRACGYDGDVVLWVSQLDSATRSFLQSYDIGYQYYWEMNFVPVHFMAGRNFSYYRHICTMANQNIGYDRILLTDVGDVVFQAHPFAAAPPGELLVFLEDKPHTIDTCPVNSYWVRAAFGNHALEALRGRRLSCAGTVLGTWRGIMRYLLVVQAGILECAASARRIEGIDQAVHNVMLYRGKLPEATVTENAQHVFTMGYVPAQNVLVTPEGQISDGAGRVSPIIHQYNRHPLATALIRKRYASG